MLLEQAQQPSTLPAPDIEHVVVGSDPGALEQRAHAAAEQRRGDRIPAVRHSTDQVTVHRRMVRDVCWSVPAFRGRTVNH